MTDEGDLYTCCGLARLRLLLFRAMKKRKNNLKNRYVLWLIILTVCLFLLQNVMIFSLPDKTLWLAEILENYLHPLFWGLLQYFPWSIIKTLMWIRFYFNYRLTSCYWMKVASLRQRFNHSIAPGGLAGDRRGVVPASGFSFSAQQMWKVIKENKDLDLPAHKVIIDLLFWYKWCNMVLLLRSW